MKVLNQLLQEQWEYTLKNSPETATVLGDLRYNDRWTEISKTQIEKDKKTTQNFLKRFEAIDSTGFSATDQLNKDLMIYQLKETLKNYDLKLYEMPFNQMWGLHLQFPGFISSIPFDNVKQYQDYTARLKQIPLILDQGIQLAKQGQKDGLIPPKYLLEKVAKQIDSIATPAGADSVFASPLKQFPSNISKAEQERLSREILQAIDQNVRPAYQKLGTFIQKDYLPYGRQHEGIWSLPNGDELYRFYVENNTTTSESPETIHQLGLKEVARIEAEMLKIAKAQGFNDLKSFQQSLKTNPAVFPKSREEILEIYRGYIAQMQPELPKLFGLLPKNKVEVLPVEQYREKEAAGAEYHQGTPDGSRPGQVYVNTGDFSERSKISMEATAYHEAIPGHHMQIDIAQNLPNLPMFRKQPNHTAYIEGWALYAEQLGKDVGFYKDPLSDYGRLSSELFRACRLVVDTGVHYKKWTRQQMIDFMREHSALDEPDIQAEADRYIAIPAQALAYKMGQLKILELRELAKQELGDRFDIKAFHDMVLNAGTLPLNILDARIKNWIKEQKAAA
ncbi:signal peptide [Acinetobacter baumannii]|nr:signal peptide [Acinetobacter baumannii]